MSTVRCFVAIPLPECIKGPLRDAVTEFKLSDRHWAAQKWVREDQWHVTLKFLGDVDESLIEELMSGLGLAAGSRAPFEIALRGIEPKPRGRARMIWAAFVDADGACGSLHEAVERATLGVGVPPDDRPFVPHATLCRARAPHRVSAEALIRANDAMSAPSSIMSVASYTLFASRLTPRGPIYSELATWDFDVAG